MSNGGEIGCLARKLPMVMLSLPATLASLCLWMTTPPPQPQSTSAPTEHRPRKSNHEFPPWEQSAENPVTPSPSISVRRNFEIPAHMLPMEYRGLGVLAAEALEYEGGMREVRCVLEGFLGQENVLVSFLSDMLGNPLATTAASAERVSLFVPEPYFPSVQSGLTALGFPATREKYGARTLHVKIPATENFFSALEVLSRMLANRAEIMFCPPESLHAVPAL